MNFVRRIGPSPKEIYGPKTPAVDGCPDIWELDTGDFAVIGFKAPPDLYRSLPEGAGCGPDEDMIVLSRKTLLAAKASIPEA